MDDTVKKYRIRRADRLLDRLLKDWYRMDDCVKRYKERRDARIKVRKDSGKECNWKTTHVPEDTVKAVKNYEDKTGKKVWTM